MERSTGDVPRGVAQLGSYQTFWEPSDTSSDVELAIRKVFHCSMSRWLAQRKASDGHLPTLDALKVDENVD